jgi:hypothetical protein
VVVEHLLRLSGVLQYVEVESLALLTVLILHFPHFLLSIRHNFFPIRVDSIVTPVYLLLQTVIKTGFPKIDDLIRPSRDKIVALPTELSGIGVRLQSILKSSLLTVPNLGGSVFGRADKIRRMRMKIDTFDWPLMPFINLYDMLRSQIV